jgi:hypothetical protein
MLQASPLKPSKHLHVVYKTLLIGATVPLVALPEVALVEFKGLKTGLASILL